jgi:hypothetical protein
MSERQRSKSGTVKPVTETGRREEPGMRGATTENTWMVFEGGATKQTGPAAGPATEQVLPSRSKVRA